MYIGGTVVRVGKSFSALPFNATRGVKQGCLLSPLLFNIALDAAFRTAIPNMQPCSEMEVDLTLLAYADDMALCAHTPQQLQHNIDTLTAALAAIGLRVNIKKTETMSTPAAASEGKHRSKAAQVKSTKRRAGDKPTTPMEVVQDEVDGSPICLYPMAAADEKLFLQCPYPDCGTAVQNPRTIRDHWLKVHSCHTTVLSAEKHKTERANALWKRDVGSMTCYTCGSLIRTPIQLANHECTPQTKTDYHCGNCNKYFSRRADLTRHHDAKKPTCYPQRPFHVPAAQPWIPPNSTDVPAFFETAPTRRNQCPLCRETYSDATKYSQHSCTGYRTQDTPEFPNLRIYDNPIKHVETFRYLGVHLADDGDTEAELKDKIRRVRITMAGLKRLWGNHRGLCTKKKIGIVQMVCATVLYYAPIVNLTTAESRALDKLEYDMLRFVLNARPHVTNNPDGTKKYRMPPRDALIKCAGGWSIAREYRKHQLLFAQRMMSPLAGDQPNAAMNVVRQSQQTTYLHSDWHAALTGALKALDLTWDDWGQPRFVEAVEVFSAREAHVCEWRGGNA
jgi:hypothetical protein